MSSSRTKLAAHSVTRYLMSVHPPGWSQQLHQISRRGAVFVGGMLYRSDNDSPLCEGLSRGTLLGSMALVEVATCGSNHNCLPGLFHPEPKRPSTHMPSPKLSFDTVPEVFDLLAIRGDLPIPSRIEPIIWPPYAREPNGGCSDEQCLACNDGISRFDQRHGFRFCEECRQRLVCETENEVTAQLCARISLVCRDSYRTYRWTTCEWRPLWYMNVNVPSAPSDIPESTAAFYAKVPLRFMTQRRCVAPPSYRFSVPRQQPHTVEDIDVSIYRATFYRVKSAECYVSIGTMKLSILKPFCFSVSSTVKQGGKQMTVYCESPKGDTDICDHKTTQAEYEIMWLMSYTVPANWWKHDPHYSARSFHAMQSGAVAAADIRDALCSLSCATDIERAAYEEHFESRRRQCAQFTQKIVDVITTRAPPLLETLRKRKRHDVTMSI